MIIQTQDGTKLNVPDGLTQAQIGEVIDHYAQTQAAAQQPTVTPPQDVYDRANAFGQNVAQGATFGTADEIGHGIAEGLGPVGYAAGRGMNALQQLFGAGNPNPPSYADYSANLDANKAATMEPMTRFNSEHPIIGGIQQAAGAITSGRALAELAKSVAPGAVNAATAFAKSHPYWAAAGTGAVTGEIYGTATGEGDLGTRAEKALPNMALSAVLGPVAVGVGRNVVGPIVEKGKSALQNFLTASEEEAATAGAGAGPATSTAAPGMATPAAAPVAPAAPPEISSITNEPLTPPAAPTSQAVGPASMTGKLPLSPGVKASDPNLLRIEEDARQGLLGKEAQDKINAANGAVYQDARRAVQQLKGVTNKDSDELLSGAVQQFQDAGKTMKSAATKLYDERDQMLANTTVNKKMVGPSLGGALNDAKTDPKMIAAFKSKAGAPAQALYDDFKTLMTGGDKELPMVDLTAWRQDVAAEAIKQPGSPASVAAGKLGRAYDDWMDNEFHQGMVINGDAGVAEKAAAASKAWKQYKGLFGSENSSVIEGMVKPYDATPRDFVDTVFGANIQGNGKTALNMRKMVAALPDDAAKAQFKQNVFSGLVDRVFDGARDADNVTLGKLRDNLQKLQGSQIYKEHFAGDKEKDVVITNLVKDLNQYITQRGRKDVISPSGGAVMRGLQKILGPASYVPVVGKAAKVADTVINKGGDMAQAATDRRAFNEAMRGFSQQAAEAAKQGKVFDIDSLKTGLVSGVASKSVLQNKEKDGNK